MVHQVPDPPKEEAAVSSPADLAVVMATDSEDEDDTPYAGYTMLPSDPNEDQHDSEEENSITNANPVEPSTFDKSTTDEKVALWSEPQTAPKPDMSREQSDAVLKAMEGFNLPPSATPAWAINVGEDIWKNHLLEKIRNT